MLKSAVRSKVTMIQRPTLSPTLSLVSESASRARNESGSASPHRAMLHRARLLDVMSSRLDRVATVITAGAGFGKSTLIQQTIDDPMTKGRVSYVIHRVLARDIAGNDLASSLARQIGAVAAQTVADRASPDAAFTDVALADVSLADQLWHLSPHHVTVVVDDIHFLPPGSQGWTLLNDLLLNLPDNADMILSGRGHHQLTLARLLARGEVVEIDEAMLKFTADEVDEFARLRTVPRNALADHGWPALAELQVHAGIAGAHAFVAQEVLDQLPTERVDALRLVALHDTVDDELVRAATDFDGTAAQLLRGLPLVAEADDERSWTLHDLWRNVLTDGLSQEQRRGSLVAGANRLRRSGKLRAALAETIAAEDDDATLDTLVEFARDLQFVQTIADRRAVLEMLPKHFESAAETELLRADIAFATEPARAAGPLQRAIDVATVQNRPEVTVLALLRLGDLAYRSGDRRGLVESQRRLERLHKLGGTGADAALALTESWLLMLNNAAADALLLMSNPALLGYPPVASIVKYYRAVQLGHAGRAAASLDALDELRETSDARILERRGGFASLMRWWAGELTADERSNAIELLNQLGDDRQHHLFVEGAATAALFCASVGDVAGARRLLDQASAQRDRVPSAAWGAITVELATAIVELMDGDESSAAARLDAALPIDGPFDGFARHVFGNVGAALYVLVPRSRAYFEAETIGPDLALATKVGEALVALRERQSTVLAARLPWNDIARLRTWAFEPHLAELAIGAMAAGNQSASRALATLVHNPRGMLRAVAQLHGDPVAHLAEDELAHTPHRPAQITYVNVLGPTAVSVGTPPDAATGPIRRTMVRELLLLLVHRGRMRRDEIAALLWPDKDDNSARNNLRATLSHLRALLEQQPGHELVSTDDASANQDEQESRTDDSGPPWHVRADGETVELFRSDRLVIDADRFAHCVAAARRHDRDRLAAPTLEACREAVSLYRGEYLADAFDSDLAFNQRLAFHLDHVALCIRASELCESRSGSLDDALDFARRAVDAEPLSEPAHRALIRALIAHSDPLGARRAYEQVVQILGNEGLDPDVETTRLGVTLSSS
jgi:LuxR family transcriptional regulator, maltose regulon positive regulatory protein